MEISMTVLWFPWHIKVQRQQLGMLWQRALCWKHWLYST